MQPGGGFVQNVQGATGGFAGEFGGQFHALGFATAQGGGLLAEPQIAQADFGQGLQRIGNLGHGAEEVHALVHGHVEHVGDVLALVGDLKGLAVVTLAVARLAGDIDRRQEVHLDFENAVALAFFAATALDVKAKAAGFVAAHLGGGQPRKEVADVIEHAGVSGGIAARGAADGRLVNDDDLVETLVTLEDAVFAGTLLGAVKLAKQRAAQNVIHKGALAGTAHAGDTGERAQRNPHINVLQVVFLGPENFQPAFFLGGRNALFGHGNAQFAGQILAGERGAVGQNFRQRAGGDQFAAMNPGAGAEIKNVIGGANGVGIMLNDEHGVAEVAQSLERGEQTVVVTLVQADAGFVQHIEHANERGTNLGGQSNALGFAAAKGAALAVQRQVAQPDVAKETEAGANFLHHFAGDLLLEFGELERHKKLVRLVHGQAADIHDGVAGNFDFGPLAFELRGELLAAEGHRQNFRLEPLAIAPIAEFRAHVSLEPVADEFAFAVGGQPFQIGQHAFEGTVNFAHLAAAPEGKFNIVLAGPVHQNLAEILGQILVGRLQADLEVAGQRAQHGLVIHDQPLAGTTPRLDGTIQRQFHIRNDQGFIKHHLLTKSMADGTRAGGGVEREMLGRGRIVALAGGRRAHLIGVQRLDPFAGGRRGGCLARLGFGCRRPCPFGQLVQRKHHAFAPAQSGFGGIAEAHANLVIYDQAIHNDLDIVKFLFVEFDAGDVFAQLDHLAIHAGAHKAFTGKTLKDIAELALLAADHRREQHHLGLGRQRQNLVHNVARGLGRNGHAGLGAMRLADVRVQQAQVIVNLGGGGDDRTRAAARAALLDGNGRREAFNEIHVRLLQLVQKLAGVGGERLNIFALALGVNGVKGERRFAAAAEAGDHHQLVAGNLQRQVLEVMLPRPSDFDECFAHNGQFCVEPKNQPTRAREKSKAGVGNSSRGGSGGEGLTIQLNHEWTPINTNQSLRHKGYGFKMFIQDAIRVLGAGFPTNWAFDS